MQVTQYRTEFVRQNEARILPRVTMTQFICMIGALAVAVGLLQVPLWLAPLCLAAGYAAGTRYRGALLARRGLALLLVAARQAVGRPRVINLAARWQQAEEVSS